MQPSVSILVPVYNAESFLPQCLDSVLGQTYANLQVVLIDDGSTDGSWQLMKEYAEKDSLVEIYHQENQGVSPTRNNLLEKVKGDYVLFVDSDDWIESDMVEYLVSLSQSYSSGFVMCDRVMNDTPISTVEPIIFELNQEKAVEDFLLHEYFIGSLCNKLFESRLVVDMSFDGNIWYGEDALFCWGVLQKVDKVVVTTRQLYHYRDVDSSISHQTFGEKKLTGHQVWRILTDEVKVKWPQCLDIALSTWALEDVHLLQAASQGGYPHNNNIKSLQRNVRDKYRLLLPRIKNNIKTFIYATMIMWWYGYGNLYYGLYQIKGRKGRRKRSGNRNE